MRVLVLNDLHLSGVPPRSCCSEYTQDLFAGLEELREFARRSGVDVTVCTGDTFHEKRTTPHWLVERAIRLFHDWPGEKLWIAGNHDMGPAGIESVRDQPLGVLVASGAVHWLREDEVRDYAGLRVQWSPANYDEKLDLDPSRLSVKRFSGVDRVIKVVHGSLMASQKTFPFPAIPYRTVPLDGIDVVLHGHIHHDQGEERIGDTVFVAFGSLGRVANEPGNHRVPRVAVLDITREEVKVRAYRVRSMLPPSALFVLPVDQRLKRDRSSLETYLQKLRAIEPGNPSSLEEALSAFSSIDNDILSIVKRLLEEADESNRDPVAGNRYVVAAED